eukprot:s4805_g1.t1
MKAPWQCTWATKLKEELQLCEAPALAKLKGSLDPDRVILSLALRYQLDRESAEWDLEARATYTVVEAVLESPVDAESNQVWGSCGQLALVRPPGYDPRRDLRGGRPAFLTGATRRTKEPPVAVAISERAFFDWLVVFGLLKGHAGYQRVYLLPRMKENVTLEKMATYADAMVTTARPPRGACRLWLEAIGPNTARGRRCSPRSQDREGELDEREIAAGLGSWLHPAGKATAATEEEANTLAGELRREWANEAIVATVPAEIPPAENIHEDPQEGR